MITACARAACSWGGVVGVVVSLRLGEWPGACCKSQIPGTPAIPKHAHAAPDNHPEKKGERNDEIKNAPHEKSLQKIAAPRSAGPAGVTDYQLRFNDEGLRCSELTRENVTDAMAEAPENGGREIFRL